MTMSDLIIGRRAFIAGVAASIALSAFATGTSKLVFAGGRFRFPNRNFQALASNHNLAILSDVYFVTPGYPTRDHRCLFSGYWFNGGTQYEVPANNPYPVMCSLSMNGGPHMMAPAHGANCFTVNPSANLWTDRGVDSGTWYPPYSLGNVRTLTWLTDGQWRMGSINPNQTGTGYMEGCRVSNNYADLIPCLTDPTVTYNAGGPHGINSSMVAPQCVVALGPTNACSFLGTGDSIMFDKTALTFDANNNVGMFVRGLHNAGFGIADFGFSGATLATEGDPNGSFKKRLAALQLLDANPFDTLWSDCGTNDIVYDIEPSIPIGYLNAEIDRFQSLFGPIKIIHNTLLPKTSGDFTTVAGQTPKPGAQAGHALSTFNDYVLSGAGGRITPVDLNKIFRAQNNPNPNDPPDVWRTNSDTQSFTDGGVHPNDLGHDTGALEIANLALSL